MSRKKKLQLLISIISIAIIVFLSYQLFVMHPQRKQIRDYGLRAIQLSTTGYIFPEVYRATGTEIPEEIVNSMIEDYKKEYSNIYSSGNPSSKRDLDTFNQLVQDQVDGRLIVYYDKSEILETGRVRFNHNNSASIEFIVLSSWDTEDDFLGDGMTRYTNEGKFRYRVSFVKEDGVWKVYSIEFNFA